MIPDPQSFVLDPHPNLVWSSRRRSAAKGVLERNITLTRSGNILPRPHSTISPVSCTYPKIKYGVGGENGAASFYAIPGKSFPVTYSSPAFSHSSLPTFTFSYTFRFYGPRTLVLSCIGSRSSHLFIPVSNQPSRGSPYGTT